MEQDANDIRSTGNGGFMMTAELRMSQNVRSHVLMVDCCEICYTVTEEWDICRMHKIPVLACRPCQQKLKRVLHPVTLAARV